MSYRKFIKGFTLIELLLVVAILVITLAAILASIMGQLALSEHARNMSLALNDANRIVEQIRENNKGCTTPSNVPPGAGITSWDAWLVGAGGGKSLPVPLNERILVTCLSADGAARCIASQIGANEWNIGSAGPTVVDPMRVTVSVCWRHRGRVVGECSWSWSWIQMRWRANGTVS